MIGATLLFYIGFAEAGNELAGRWSTTGVTTATVEVAMNDQSQWVGVIAQCDTSEWIGKSLLTDFQQQSDQTWKAILHSPKYSVSKEVRLEKVSQTDLEVVADFVVFEKRFVWHSVP